MNVRLWHRIGERHHLEPAMSLCQLASGGSDRSLRYQPCAIKGAVLYIREVISNEGAALAGRKGSGVILRLEGVARLAGHLVARPDCGDVDVFVADLNLGRCHEARGAQHLLERVAEHVSLGPRVFGLHTDVIGASLSLSQAK